MAPARQGLVRDVARARQKRSRTAIEPGRRSD